MGCANGLICIETQEREAKHRQLPLDENVPQGGWTEEEGWTAWLSSRELGLCCFTEAGENACFGVGDYSIASLEDKMGYFYENMSS